MSNFSDYLENQLLGATLCKSTFTSPSTIHVALFTACTSDGTEVTEVPVATGYARRVADFNAPASGAAKNEGAITFTEATTPWGTITHVGLYDALTTGNLLYWGELDTSREITAGDTFQIPDDNLTITLD